MADQDLVANQNLVGNRTPLQNQNPNLVNNPLQNRTPLQNPNPLPGANPNLVQLPQGHNLNHTLLQGQFYNPMADPMSPFCLHLGENPGTCLVSILLTAQNYNVWARAMRMALKSKNKLHFIDGLIPKPPEHDPLFLVWDRCNTFVISWIHQSLSPEILQSVLLIEVASELWRDLRHRYYQGDMFRIAML